MRYRFKIRHLIGEHLHYLQGEVESESSKLSASQIFDLIAGDVPKTIESFSIMEFAPVTGVRPVAPPSAIAM